MNLFSFKSMVITCLFAGIVSVLPAGVCRAQTDDETVSAPEETQKPNPFVRFSSKALRNKKLPPPDESSDASSAEPPAVAPDEPPGESFTVAPVVLPDGSSTESFADAPVVLPDGPPDGSSTTGPGALSAVPPDVSTATGPGALPVVPTEGSTVTGPGVLPAVSPDGSSTTGPGALPAVPPDGSSTKAPVVLPAGPAGRLRDRLPPGASAGSPAGLIQKNRNIPPAPGKTKEGMDNKGLVNIDFNNVDITVFIKYISETTGKNFVIDDRVKGKITIVSPTRVSKDDAYKVFESVLEVYGFATIKAGDVIKVVPAMDAKTKNIETRLKEETGLPDDRIITQLIPLKYADASNIKQLFAPLVSKNSVILSYSPTNMLIITDVDSNIKRLLHILGAIDVTGIGQEVAVIPLEMADAAKLVKILDTVFKETTQAKKGEGGKTIQFVPDERTNSIIVVASDADTTRARELIKILDREVPRGKEKIHVYYLENATAEDLAAVLQAMPQKKAAASSDGKKTAPVVSDDVKITADKATNSLIIMAENTDYQVLEEIIKMLDIPRAMVYIECLIMEVNINKSFNFGVEWSAGTDKNIRGVPGAVGGGFSGSTLYGNTKAIAGLSTTSPGISQFPAGFSLGVFAEPLTIGDLTFPNLGAIVQAYKTDEDVHILSTPQVLTTDNEEASITVGKNVPYQTKVSTSDNDTYNSFEYKDVGITLKITPQISKDRRIRLKISQESSRLVGGEVTAQPTTYKRAIDTTVVVNDGNTIVIGGLIDDSFSVTEYKVPCLGDLPVFRWLFSSIGDTREKTNLYVFLTPRVVENANEAMSVYKDKKADAEKMQGGKVKMYKESTEDKKD